MVSYLDYAIMYLLACIGLGDLDLYEDTLFPDESAAALFTGCPLSYDNDLDLLRGDLDLCLNRGELQIKRNNKHQLVSLILIWGLRPIGVTCPHNKGTL